MQDAGTTTPRARRRRLPSWLRKSLVAVAGAGSFLLDYYVADSGSLVDSLTLGLMVSILVALIETQTAITDTAAETQAQVEELRRQVQAEVGDVSTLNRLRDSIREEFGSRFLVAAVLDYEWARFEDRLESLSNGKLRSKGFEALITSAAASPECRSLMGVTTLPSPSAPGRSWWLSSAGIHYRRLNADLARSGVPVERIWIYRDPAELDTPECRLLLDEHAEAGILTRVYKWRDDALVPNFTIWNDEAAWEATLNWDGTMISGTFYVSADDVRRLRVAWDRLSNESMPWPPTTAIPAARASSADDASTKVAPTTER